jgi:hypothetical protein
LSSSTRSVSRSPRAATWVEVRSSIWLQMTRKPV